MPRVRRYLPTLIFYDSAEEPALAESVTELRRQMEAHDYNQCVLM